MTTRPAARALTAVAPLLEGEEVARIVPADEPNAWRGLGGTPVRRDDGSELARWYVPNDTLVAWIADEAVYGVLAEGEHIDWVGRYEPAYKLDPRIGASAIAVYEAGVKKHFSSAPGVTDASFSASCTIGTVG